jgi:hypothetical protein
LKRVSAITVVNIFIVASLVGAGVIGGLVAETVAGPEPTISIGSVVGVFSSGSMQLHIPVIVHDGGLLGMRGLRIAVNISDDSGDQLITGSSGPFDVAPNSVQRVNLTLTADMRALPNSEVYNLLTQDQNLHLEASLVASEQPLVSVHGAVAGTLPWGAVMDNLTFGGGTVTQINSTYSQVAWPYSFANRNQYFRLVANATGSVTDRSGIVVGRILPASLVVIRGASFDGRLTAVVANSALQSSDSLTLVLEVQQSNLFQTQISVTVNA